MADLKNHLKIKGLGKGTAGAVGIIVGTALVAYSERIVDPSFMAIWLPRSAPAISILVAALVSFILKELFEIWEYYKEGRPLRRAKAEIDAMEKEGSLDKDEALKLKKKIGIKSIARVIKKIS